MLPPFRALNGKGADTAGIRSEIGFGWRGAGRVSKKCEAGLRDSSDVGASRV